MKNRILKLLMLLVLGLGTHTSVANASQLDGGIVFVDIGKTGNTGTFLSLPLPDSYLGADGVLLLPIKLSLINAENQEIHLLETFDTSISIPDVKLPKGKYTLLVKIGDVQHKASLLL